MGEVIDLSEIREAIQKVEEWSKKVENYFDEKGYASDAETEMLDYITDGEDYCRVLCYKIALEMIADGDVTAKYDENGTIVLVATDLYYLKKNLKKPQVN